MSLELISELKLSCEDLGFSESSGSQLSLKWIWVLSGSSKRLTGWQKKISLSELLAGKFWEYDIIQENRKKERPAIIAGLFRLLCKKTILLNKNTEKINPVFSCRHVRKNTLKCVVVEIREYFWKCLFCYILIDQIIKVHSFAIIIQINYRGDGAY